MKSLLIKDKKNWDLTLRKFKNFDAYHILEYLELYKSSTSEPNLFIFKDEENIFALPFLKKTISNSKYYDFETAYGYGGPLSTSLDQKFLTSAWQEFIKDIKKEKIIAGIIRFNPILNSEEMIKNSYVKIIYKCSTVVLNCNKSLETVRNNYAKDIKKRIKNNKKYSFVVDVSNNKKKLEQFSKIYLERMKSLNADKEYFFDKIYFNKFIRIPEKNWKLLTVFYDNKMIGGTILFFNNEICNVHLSSSIKAYFKLSPNIIIRDNIIKYCYENKIKHIHFGGGRTNKNDDSLLQFKKKFCDNCKTYWLGGIITNDQIYKKKINKFEIEKGKISKFKDYFLKYRY